MNEQDMLYLTQLLLLGNIYWMGFFIGHPLVNRRRASWFIMVTGIFPGLLLSFGTLFLNFAGPSRIASSTLGIGSVLLWSVLRKPSFK